MFGGGVAINMVASYPQVVSSAQLEPLGAALRAWGRRSGRRAPRSLLGSISIAAGFADSEWGDQSILQSDYSTAKSVSSPPTTFTNGNSINYGGFILDPENTDIVFAVLKSGGLLKVELSTFNNFVYSW